MTDLLVLTTVPRTCSLCGGTIPPGMMLVPRVRGRLDFGHAVHVGEADDD